MQKKKQQKHHQYVNMWILKTQMIASDCILGWGDKTTTMNFIGKSKEKNKSMLFYIISGIASVILRPRNCQSLHSSLLLRPCPCPQSSLGLLLSWQRQLRLLEFEFGSCVAFRLFLAGTFPIISTQIQFTETKTEAKSLLISVHTCQFPTTKQSLRIQIFCKQRCHNPYPYQWFLVVERCRVFPHAAADTPHPPRDLCYEGTVEK